MADNTYGFKPEDYADLKTNHPQLDKTQSSGKAPILVLVNEDTEGGSSPVLFVKLIENDNTNGLSCETSVADIYNALNDGKLVYLRAYKYYPDAPQEYAYETNGTTCFVTAIDWQGEGEDEQYIIRFTENVRNSPALYSCGIVDGADVWSQYFG